MDLLNVGIVRHIVRLVPPNRAFLPVSSGKHSFLTGVQKDLKATLDTFVFRLRPAKTVVTARSPERCGRCG